jgi:hypothetical protein
MRASNPFQRPDSGGKKSDVPRGALRFSEVTVALFAQALR